MCMVFITILSLLMKELNNTIKEEKIKMTITTPKKNFCVDSTLPL